MYKNIRAAVAGSINMDIILNMKKVPEVGENVLGTDYGYACGGKGANQAIGLSRLGARVKMIGKVGNDSEGEKLLNNLKNNNVEIDDVSIDGSQTGLAAIIIDGDGKNRIVVYEGANSEIHRSSADPKKHRDGGRLLYYDAVHRTGACDHLYFHCADHLPVHPVAGEPGAPSVPPSQRQAWPAQRLCGGNALRTENRSCLRTGRSCSGSV